MNMEINITLQDRLDLSNKEIKMAEKKTEQLREPKSSRPRRGNKTRPSKKRKMKNEHK
jgi:hypothetical protein